MRQILPALLLSLAATSVLCSAPAPLPKPRPVTRASLVGTWRALWGATHCEIELRQDGGYRCLYCGTVYVGSWALLDGKLVIQEQPEASDHPCQPLPLYFVWQPKAEAWLAGPCMLVLSERVRK